MEIGVGGRPEQSVFVQVAPGLWLANLLGMLDRRHELYDQYSIRHVLNAGQPYPAPVEVLLRPVEARGIKWKTLGLDDRMDAHLLQQLPEVVEYIDEGLRTGHGVLVHCVAAVSRSVSCILAYWIAKEGLSLRNALDRMRKVRPLAKPNWGFGLQLLAWSKRCNPRPSSSDAEPCSPEEPAD